MAIIYGLKVNLSVAMVAMVNHTAVRLQSSHGLDEHGPTIMNLSNFKGEEECSVENRTSSTVSQVSIQTAHQFENKNLFD